MTALIGGSETATEVSTAEELTAAIADVNFDTVKLAADINIDTTLTVNRTVTLDLNGKVLQMTGSGSVIKVESSGNLTLTDSNTAAEHKFMPNGKLWVLDEANGKETVTGGVITGGKGYPFHLISSTVNCGGGVYIAPSGQLTMTGGNIIGCSAEFGGGVCIYPRQNGEQIQFSMSGGSIAGCVASDIGGGVCATARSKCQVRRSFAAAPSKARTILFAAEAYMSTVALKCLARQQSKAVRQSPILPTAEAYLSTAAVAL